MQYNQQIQTFITPEALKRYATTDVGTNEMLARLQGLTCEDIFPDGYEDVNMASCCLAGLWLLHNFLHQGHEICQDIGTPEGSFWHAIMHRTEGDYPNAKYWYRLAKADRLNDAISSIAGRTYVPNQFVDALEQNGIESVHELAVAEWQVLFEHCYNRSAITQ